MPSAAEGRLFSPGWPVRALPWALSGLLYGLAFPKFDLTWLAWGALVPMLCAARLSGRPSREVFLGAWGAGLLGNLFIYFWLWPTFVVARIDGPTTLLSWTILSGLLALYFPAFTFFYRALPGTAARIVLGAFGWVALDEIRSVILSGFPWALLSHSQVWNETLIQVASISGAAGITFLLMIVNLSLAEAATASLGARKPSGFRPVAVAAAVVGLALGWGHYRLSASANLATRPLKVSLLQGNIDQYRKWDDAYEADIRDVYQRLAVKAASLKPDVILWPETSVPAYIPTDKKYVQWLVGIASATATPHLFGSLSSNGKMEFNAAFLMRADGRLEGQYNKRHLVPFGEYVPLSFLLSKVVPYLGQVGLFQAGEAEKIFDVNGFKLSPNICYEAMFPGLVRQSVRNADVIVNLTNDGWFLDSSGPHQDFAVNILRAVENGRPVLRAANTGISAVIDAYGRVLIQSPLLVEGAYTATVPVPPHEFRTFYGLGHNWFGWLSGGVALLTFVGLLRRRFRRAGGAG